METNHPSDKKNEIVSAENPMNKVSKDFQPISFFKKDKNFVFSHQKIEKLVSAVYMVTNFLSSEEPIKWTLRNLGTKLLRLNIDLKASHSVSREKVEGSIKDTVLEIVSLLEIASFSGLISTMNFEILQREFHSLLNHIGKISRDQKTEDPSLLQSPFFAIEESEQSTISPKGEEVKHGVSSHTHIHKHEEKMVAERQVVKDKIENTLEKPNRLKEFGPVAIKKNKRQSIIINLLKRKKEIMVKDVAEIISECSEKTLQRELLSLVSQGILNKEGERRWTKYSLAGQ